MGTSSSHTGGTGGAWTGFKQSASRFARHGGGRYAGRALAGHVATLGGAAGATSGAVSGVGAGQSLVRFLVGSTGPTGVAGGLESVGLAHLVGADRFAILSELLDRFGGPGSDLEAQAARGALLDVLDDLLPVEEEVPLEDVRLDEAAVVRLLERYLAALVYNRAIPVIDERLTRLEDPQLARRRDGELRDFIAELVRLRTRNIDLLSANWSGLEGRDVIEGILLAVYGQLEEWE